ncbi:MAG: PUA domain-containing protein [Nitrososphaeria archaeon]
MHEVYISKKDAKRIVNEARRQLKVEITGIDEKGNKYIEIDKDASILLLGRIVLIKEEDKVFPSLVCPEYFLEKFPIIKVDKGAIPFICKGANVMRPGIVSFERNFSVDDVVCVREELYNKFIAVGRALIEKDKAEKSSKGAVLNNLHYVGDKYWDFLRNVRTQ